MTTQSRSPPSLIAANRLVSSSLPSRASRSFLLAAAFLAGCLPLELDVAPQGALVISRQEGWFLFDPASGAVSRLRAAGADLPVFAQVSPDGEQLLTVAEVQGGIGQFDLRIGPVGGEEFRLLLRTRNPTYLRFSPDGSQIALTRMSTKRIEPGQDDEALELVLVHATSGEVRRLAEGVAPLIRWIGAGPELLAVQFVKTTQQGHRLGDLVRIDATSGNVTPVVRLLVGECGHLDVSADGRQASLCVFAVGPRDSEFTVADFPPQRLFLVDLTTGATRPTDQAARYALFSPDGQSLLVGLPPPNGTLARGTKLLVTDAKGDHPQVLADDLFVAEPIGGESQVYPGWIDDQRVYYFSERLVYGRTGRALSLMTVHRDGTERRCVQPDIDRVASTSR
jgi:hypothetical protein